MYTAKLPFKFPLGRSEFDINVRSEEILIWRQFNTEI
jgi:hypothetical protein